MTGSLQTKNGMLYAVLNTKGRDGKRKLTWVPTGFPEKGSTRNAQKVLRALLDEYEEREANQSQEVLFTDFALQWLERRKLKVDEVTSEGYETDLKITSFPTLSRWD